MTIAIGKNEQGFEVVVTTDGGAPVDSFQVQGLNLAAFKGACAKGLDIAAPTAAGREYAARQLMLRFRASRGHRAVVSV